MRAVALLREILAEADDYTARTGTPLKGWPEKVRKFLAGIPYTGRDQSLIDAMWSGAALTDEQVREIAEKWRSAWYDADDGELTVLAAIKSAIREAL